MQNVGFSQIRSDVYFLAIIYPQERDSYYTHIALEGCCPSIKIGGTYFLGQDRTGWDGTRWDKTGQLWNISSPNFRDGNGMSLYGA